MGRLFWIKLKPRSQVFLKGKICTFNNIYLLYISDLLKSHRELLVSIRFNEPGWQWSGCFLPDHLGDTQVKMQNHVSGAVSMIRLASFKTRHIVLMARKVIKMNWKVMVFMINNSFRRARLYSFFFFCFLLIIFIDGEVGTGEFAAYILCSYHWDILSRVIGFKFVVG
ncbi:hypothetical protein ACSBR1_000614 [Camellia fascicularis]